MLLGPFHDLEHRSPGRLDDDLGAGDDHLDDGFDDDLAPVALTGRPGAPGGHRVDA